MGLFGGFKAKFTRNAPKKKQQTEQVVCLKYKTFSEFDAPATSQQNGTSQETKVIKPPAKPRQPIAIPSQKKITAPRPQSALLPETGAIKKDTNNNKNVSKAKSSVDITDVTDDPLYETKNFESANNYSITSNDDGENVVKNTNDVKIAATFEFVKSTTKNSNDEDVVVVESSNHLYGYKNNNLEYEEHRESLTETTYPRDNSDIYGEVAGRNYNDDEYKSTLMFMTENHVESDIEVKNREFHQPTGSLEIDIVEETTTYQNQEYQPATNKFININNSESDEEEETTTFRNQENQLPTNTFININPEFGEEEETTTFHNEEYQPPTNKFININNPESDEEDYPYTVNIAKYDDAKSYQSVDQSEDDISIPESPGNVPDYNAMGYSSHAASIFFGGDEGPDLERQRNINFDERDNLSQGSSASA